MAHDAAKIAATYFDAWKVNDFDTMRSLVDDDITFAGPLAQLEGAQDYMEGIKGMSRIKSVKRKFIRQAHSLGPVGPGPPLSKQP